MRGQFSFPYFDPGHSVGTKPCSGPLCVKQLDLRVLRDLATKFTESKTKQTKWPLPGFLRNGSEALGSSSPWPGTW